MLDKKVGIVGVGNVGATLAFTLATQNICKEILLKDIKGDLLQAIALDISQATQAAKSKTMIKHTQKAAEFTQCDIVVITAGVPRKPGMSRNDLLLINAKIMSSIVSETFDYNPDAIVIIVSNPLDAMVYTALKASRYNKNRVIGMAGILDSARMSHFILEKLEYGHGKIQAQVMGGHGDDMVPLPNFSTVENVALTDILSQEDIEDIINKTRNGGAQIVKLLGNGSAYYAPAYATSLMINAILQDTKETFPCAIKLDGEYGYKGIVAGVPVVLGSLGVEEVVELKLNENQKEAFHKSITSVKELINTLESKFF